MRSPIAIIDCATTTPSYNCMNRLAETFQVPFTYHWVSQYGLDSLYRIERPIGQIIFGSDSNVEDRFDWQVELAALMKKRILDDVPTLGICFGHQLMADAFGAEIALVDPEKKLYEGTRQGKIIADKWGFLKGQSFETVVTHYFEVKNLPEDMVHLGQSDQITFDALAHKKHPYFSFQGHPEASRYFSENHLVNPISDEQYAKANLGGMNIIKTFLRLTQEFSKGN